jgi:hypothetical protein
MGKSREAKIVKVAGPVVVAECTMWFVSAS